MEDYIKGEVIGWGTFGNVYRAVHRPSGRPVALKKVRLQAHEGVHMTALREMTLLTELRGTSPHVVEFLTAFPHKDKLILVFELLPSDLDRRLKRGAPLPEAEVRSYLHQLLTGLAHIHERGVVHRDIKPDNLLLTDDGTVKLADFGLARLMPPVQQQLQRWQAAGCPTDVPPTPSAAAASASAAAAAAAPNPFAPGAAPQFVEGTTFDHHDHTHAHAAAPLCSNGMAPQQSLAATAEQHSYQVLPLEHPQLSMTGIVVDPQPHATDFTAAFANGLAGRGQEAAPLQALGNQCSRGWCSAPDVACITTQPAQEALAGPPPSSTCCNGKLAPGSCRCAESAACCPHAASQGPGMPPGAADASAAPEGQFLGLQVAAPQLRTVQQSVFGGVAAQLAVAEAGNWGPVAGTGLPAQQQQPPCEAECEGEQQQPHPASCQLGDPAASQPVQLCPHALRSTPPSSGQTPSFSLPAPRATAATQGAADLSGHATKLKLPSSCVREGGCDAQPASPAFTAVAASASAAAGGGALAVPDGLSSPTLAYTNQVCARWYRAPELLFGAVHYDSAIDIWAAGCCFAALLKGKVWLSAPTDIGQLSAIFKALGSPDPTTWPGVTRLKGYMTFSHKAPPLAQQFPGVHPLALHLLSQLLCLNPAGRPTARQALQHAYFTADLPSPTPSELPSCSGMQLCTPLAFVTGMGIGAVPAGALLAGGPGEGLGGPRPPSSDGRGGLLGGLPAAPLSADRDAASAQQQPTGLTVGFRSMGILRHHQQQQQQLLLGGQGGRGLPGGGEHHAMRDPLQVCSGLLNQPGQEEQHVRAHARGSAVKRMHTTCQPGATFILPVGGPMLQFAPTPAATCSPHDQLAATEEPGGPPCGLGPAAAHAVHAFGEHLAPEHAAEAGARHLGAQAWPPGDENINAYGHASAHGRSLLSTRAGQGAQPLDIPQWACPSAHGVHPLCISRLPDQAARAGEPMQGHAGEGQQGAGGATAAAAAWQLPVGFGRPRSSSGGGAAGSSGSHQPLNQFKNGGMLQRLMQQAGPAVAAGPGGSHGSGLLQPAAAPAAVQQQPSISQRPAHTIEPAAHAPEHVAHASEPAGRARTGAAQPLHVHFAASSQPQVNMDDAAAGPPSAPADATTDGLPGSLCGGATCSMSGMQPALTGGTADEPMSVSISSCLKRPRRLFESSCKPTPSHAAEPGNPANAGNGNMLSVQDVSTARRRSFPAPLPLSLPLDAAVTSTTAASSRDGTPMAVCTPAAGLTAFAGLGPDLAPPLAMGFTPSAGALRGTGALQPHWSGNGGRVTIDGADPRLATHSSRPSWPAHHQRRSDGGGVMGGPRLLLASERLEEEPSSARADSGADSGQLQSVSNKRARLDIAGACFAESEACSEGGGSLGNGVGFHTTAGLAGAGPAGGGGGGSALDWRLLVPQLVLPTPLGLKSTHSPAEHGSAGASVEGPQRHRLSDASVQGQPVLLARQPSDMT